MKYSTNFHILNVAIGLFLQKDTLSISISTAFKDSLKSIFTGFRNSQNVKLTKSFKPAQYKVHCPYICIPFLMNL